MIGQEGVHQNQSIRWEEAREFRYHDNMSGGSVTRGGQQGRKGGHRDSWKGWRMTMQYKADKECEHQDCHGRRHAHWKGWASTLPKVSSSVQSKGLSSAKSQLRSCGTIMTMNRRWTKRWLSMQQIMTATTVYIQYSLYSLRRRLIESWELHFYEGFYCVLNLQYGRQNIYGIWQRVFFLYLLINGISSKLY